MSQAETVRGRRIIEFDGLRGVAVLMILAWHFVGEIINLDLGFWAQTAARVTILGRTGVDLFFVLSGFLITGIILDRATNPLGFLMSFYARRALRILPPYLLLLSIFWIGVWIFPPTRVFNDNTPIWYHITFTQNYWMSNHQEWGPDGMSVTWSVAIEEQFYLVYPLLLLALPRRVLVPLLIVMAITSALFRYIFWRWEDGNVYAGYVFTLSRLDGLCIGGLVACCWRNQRVIDWLSVRKPHLTLVIFLGILGFISLGFAIAQDLAWHMFVWGHSFLAIFYGFLLISILVCNYRWMKQILCSTTLRYCGSISYSAYLFHPLFLSLLFIAINGNRPKLNNWFDASICFCAFLSTLFFSHLLYRYLESPCIKKGQRFAY